MKKKNILITGSDGRIGTFLKKKLKNEYNLINADIKNGTVINKDFLQKVFQKKIYAVILSHGKNTTPLKNKKNTKDIDLDLIRSYFETNLFLSLEIISYYLKYNKRGRIINLSSIYGVKSPKHFIYKSFSKEIGYSLSKSASNMMTKFLGTKYSKNFLFNSIVLGGVQQSNLNSFFLKSYNLNNPTGRMMKLNEIFPAINYLLDVNNTYTNSQEIIVDGGWLSW
jgi:NAD(P)-dependent dehydrogenase (short-subunit alcohol dehydrogenase family)